MPDLFSFLIVILAGVVFSALFNRLHLPWVVALIIAGIVIGPHGVAVFETTPTIDSFSDIGLVFLMFMAGLETRLSSLNELKRDIFRLFLINGLFPFAVGLGIGLALGLDPLPAVLLATIFISSSIAVVVPAFEQNKLLHVRLGRTVIGATIVSDIFSLVLLSVILQTTEPTAHIPLLLFYPIFFGSLVAIRWAVPMFKSLVVPAAGVARDLFEQELRYVFVILIGTVLLFEVLGLHPIIAGFFAGLVLSEFITSEILKEKLHTVSYGIFIPVFFVVIGSRTNLGAFEDLRSAIFLVVAVVVGSMLSKFVSGWLGGRWIGFSSSQSVLMGVASMPQLSTSLAAVSAGFAFGIISDAMMTAIIVLSLVSTFVAPILIRHFAPRADAALTPPLPTPK